MPITAAESPAALIDHSLLKATAVTSELEQLCEEAVEHGFCAVCVPPRHVALCVDRLYGSPVRVATVVGFPLGYQTLETKLAETRQAVLDGAAEIDMVIALEPALRQQFDLVENEIAQIVAAADGASVKVILECCYFDDAQKRSLVESVVRGGAAFVKTSTGFGPSGATHADLQLLSGSARGRIGVKAAGGIRDFASFCAMVEAGATRVGTSAGVEIMRQWLAGAHR